MREARIEERIRKIFETYEETKNIVNIGNRKLRKF